VEFGNLISSYTDNVMVQSSELETGICRLKFLNSPIIIIKASVTWMILKPQERRKAILRLRDYTESSYVGLNGSINRHAASRNQTANNSFRRQNTNNTRRDEDEGQGLRNV